MKISATIITYNEERNLPRAIESLRCCDEIVVIDSGSTDRTVEIAERFGARVLEANWRGYAGQKNYASDMASNDWVLSIDADEALSEDLEGEIWQLKKNGATCDGYTMPRLAQYLGKWILHSGWHPDRKIRLFDRRRARWVGEFVHESVVVDGTVGELEGNLLHYTCGSLERALEDHGPVYDAGGGRDCGTEKACDVPQSSGGTGVDIFPHVLSAARFSGWS